MSLISADNSSPSDGTRIHRWITVGVFVIALIMYVASMAPTTSFWDCGEFIACSYSLGVPHPPGAPFFLMLGRVFSMLPFHSDIGFRVNFISVLVSALTVMFTYLTIVRLVRNWRGKEESVTDQVVLYGSGVVGALGFAFSHSFWFNAVEAEVYAISMFFTALVVWLAVRWMDHAERPDSTKYLLLICYFVGVATGIHLLNVLALSPIVLLIYFKKYKFSWLGFGIAVVLSAIAILIVYPGVVAGVPYLLEMGPFWLLLVVLLGVGVLFISIRSRMSVVSLVTASILLILIGYSSYTMIYIRSNLKPVINENQPDTIQRLISYLNREQYGTAGPAEIQPLSREYEDYLRAQARGAQNKYSQLMTQARSFAKQGRYDQAAAKENEAAASYMATPRIIRLSAKNVLRLNLLERAAPFWSYQINKMYIRYIKWQYWTGEPDLDGSTTILLFPMIFAFIGAYWHFRRDPKRAIVILMLFLMTGLAIVFYLNQPDPQPRERDYAYVGSFWAMALWIGMGVVALYEAIIEAIKKPSGQQKKMIAIATIAFAILVVPISMGAQGYHTHDRSGNFVAWDYSHNMLETCEPNGIIFTNGDNDTFPLWYLQVVEGIRTDVRVVNLSLLNTDWYIKQLRDEEPKVPISLTDDFIDNVLTSMTRSTAKFRYLPTGKKHMEVPTPDGGSIEWDAPATMYVPWSEDDTPGKNNFLKVQDVMILHIIQQNRWEKPIYFAVTVSNTNLMGLRPYLTMEGLAFKLKTERVGRVAIDEKKLRENLFETYAGNYRNLDNPDVYLFPNVLKLLQNYRSGFLQLVYEYYNDAQMRPGVTSSGIPEENWGEKFEDLTSREKSLYTLRLMDQYIPETTVPMTNREILLQLGRLYAELGDKEAASVRFRNAMEVPGVTDSDNLETALYMMEFTPEIDRERARAIIASELGDNPSVEQTLNVASIFDRAKMHEELVELLDGISDRTDLSNYQKQEIATFYLGAKQYDKARGIYEALHQENPADGGATGGLLQAYLEMGDTTNAIELLQDWIEINPRDRSAQKRLEELTAK